MTRTRDEGVDERSMIETRIKKVDKRSTTRTRDEEVDERLTIETQGEVGRRPRNKGMQSMDDLDLGRRSLVNSR